MRQRYLCMVVVGIPIMDAVQLFFFLSVGTAHSEDLL